MFYPSPWETLWTPPASLNLARKFTAAAPSCQPEQPAGIRLLRAEKGTRDTGIPTQVDSGETSTAPLLSRAEASGPAPSSPHRHRPQSTPQALRGPRSSRTTTAPTRGPSHTARQLPRARSSGRSRSCIQPRLPQPAPSITNLPPSHSLPAPQAGTAPAPRMLGAVVRVPQHRLDAARGKRRTGTTAPRRPRGGEAVDGHPQRRPCPVRAGAVRAGSGGGIAPEPGMSLALPAARGGSRDLPLLALCGDLLGQLCCWREAEGFQCALAAAAAHSPLNFKQRQGGRNARINGLSDILCTGLALSC